MTDLTCRTVADQVSAFVDGELDADTGRRVVAHLTGCEGCHRYADQVRWTVRMLGAISSEWPDEAPSAAGPAGGPAGRGG